MLIHMRTSVDIPDPLLRRAKKVARDRGTTLKQLLIDGLRSILDSQGRAAPYRMKDCSFGSGGLAKGLAWSDAERLSELVYGDRE